MIRWGVIIIFGLYLGGCERRPPSDMLVIIGAGQSLIACYNGSKTYAVRNVGRIRTVNKGALIDVVDGHPSGCDGDRNTFLVPLADMILDDRRFSKVVILPIAIGGSYLKEWATGGRLSPKINEAFYEVSRLGLGRSTMLFLWEQGSQDALGSDPPAKLLADLQSVIGTVRARSRGTTIFIAREARTSPTQHASNSDAVRSVQLSVVNDFDALRGPDIDALGDEYRLPDLLHIDDYIEQARRWKAPIDAYLSKK